MKRSDVKAVRISIAEKVRYRVEILGTKEP